VQLIARDLQTTWAPVLDVDIQFDQRQQHAQVQSLMLPMEKVLSLTFEIRLPDSRGSLNLAFPAVISNALLRKLSAQWSYAERVPSREARRRLRQRMLEAEFPLNLSLPPSPLTIRELTELEVGRVLALPKRVHQPIDLNVAGKPMFRAFPVRHGSNRGAKVDSRAPLRQSVKVEDV
jgi:flagellar motor switch protein FliM